MLQFSIKLLMVLFITQCCYAHPKDITLDLQNIYLPDAIRMMAKFLRINVLISPAINGYANLHLDQASPVSAFELLLTANGLEKWRMGNVWYIAPRAELIKQKQDELKWRELRDETEQLVGATWPIKYARAQEVAQLLQDERGSVLSKRGRVKWDVRTNTIYIQDIPERIISAKRLIKTLDIPLRQIQIAAKLVSVDSDFERELGIDFSVNNTITESANSKAFQKETKGQYSIAALTLADGSHLDVKLSALERAGHAELISSPSLFTANQQPASIESGEEVPYQEVSESGGTAVTFKKAVLSLKVTPQILPGNYVLLQLKINQDRPNNKFIQGVPTISTRQIMTSILVKSGQTIVLGGIYESGRENNEERVPFMSEIPLIGWLFKQQNTRRNKRQLLIFVTPKINKQML